MMDIKDIIDIALGEGFADAAAAWAAFPTT